MRNIHIDVKLPLDDDIADWVTSLEDLKSELAAYFKLRFNGGILISPDRLTDIIDSVIDDYEDSSQYETALTDKDYDRLSDLMKDVLSQFLSNGKNIVVSNDEPEEESEQESNVVVFEEVKMESGEEQDLTDSDDALDALGDMFCF